MDGRATALLLSLVMSGCMIAGRLPATTSSEVRSIQKIAVLPVGVPAVPRVRILNSNSDWFHVPGFAAKGAYEAHVGAEVGSLLQSMAFDYGGEAARVFEQSIAAYGASVVRPAASALSENRKWPIRKCPLEIEADTCFDLNLTYFGYVAASDNADYVPTVHLSARVI